MILSQGVLLAHTDRPAYPLPVFLLACFGRQEGTYYSSLLEFLREWCFTDSHFLSRATN